MEVSFPREETLKEDNVRVEDNGLYLFLFLFILFFRLRVRA